MVEPTIVRFPALSESAANTFTQNSITLFAGHPGEGQVFEIFMIRMFIDPTTMITALSNNVDQMNWGIYTGSNTKTGQAQCNLDDARVIFKDALALKVVTAVGVISLDGYREYNMQVKDGAGFLVAASRINLWIEGGSAAAAGQVQALVLGRYKKVGLRTYSALFLQQQGSD